MAFVYILQNTNGMTYVGVSKYPLVRLNQHNSTSRSLQKHYTNRNRPWTLAAVFNGFKTRKQALRAEYMIKHQPHKIRHSVAIVARIATAQATCNHLLRTDHKFSGVNALAVVIWEQDLYQTVQCLVNSANSVAGGGVTLLYVG
jgi:predicted GIY-YIG superfamily endonuclease